MNFEFVSLFQAKRRQMRPNQMTYSSVHIKKPSACQYVICVVNAATALK